jgi:hypothetical protein
MSNVKIEKSREIPQLSPKGDLLGVDWGYKMTSIVTNS